MCEDSGPFRDSRKDRTLEKFTIRETNLVDWGPIMDEQEGQSRVCRDRGPSEGIGVLFERIVVNRYPNKLYTGRERVSVIRGTHVSCEDNTRDNVEVEDQVPNSVSSRVSTDKLPTYTCRVTRSRLQFTLGIRVGIPRHFSNLLKTVCHPQTAYSMDKRVRKVNSFSIFVRISIEFPVVQVPILGGYNRSTVKNG